MARDGKVKLNHKGIAAVLKSPAIRSVVTAKAEKVLAAAKADASGYVVTGNYLAGLEIQQDTTDRAVTRVVGTAPHSHLVEANHGTLARALGAAR
jgi:hypothetical protein